MNIKHESDDCKEFINTVTKVLNGTIKHFSPEEIYITKIDNWFDYKWSGFSRKVMGALGVRSFMKLNIPPFHPNRVMESGRYIKKENSNEYSPAKAFKLHIHQESASNSGRYIMNVASNAIFLWYSGSTNSNSQGSILIYISRHNTNSGFYAGYQKTGKDWKKSKTTGMSLSEINIIIAGDD